MGGGNRDAAGRLSVFLGHVWSYRIWYFRQRRDESVSTVRVKTAMVTFDNGPHIRAQDPELIAWLRPLPLLEADRRSNGLATISSKVPKW